MRSCWCAATDLLHSAASSQGGDKAPPLRCRCLAQAQDLSGMRSRREAARSVAASFPARHGDRRCGGGAGRARSRPPPAAPGRLPPRLQCTAPPKGQGSSRALLRPCPLGCPVPSGSPLPSLGRGLAALRGVLACSPLGSPSLRVGAPGAPSRRPRCARVRWLPLPSRGSRAQRALPFAPLRTIVAPVRKKEGAAAAAAAAQLRRPISPPGKASLHRRRSYERRPPVGVCL